MRNGSPEPQLRLVTLNGSINALLRHFDAVIEGAVFKKGRLLGKNGEAVWVDGMKRKWTWKNLLVLNLQRTLQAVKFV